MRAWLLVGVMTAGLVTIAAPAMAKGPISARIEGPGLSRPVVVDYTQGPPMAGTGLEGLLTYGRLSDVITAAVADPPPPGVSLALVSPSPGPPTRLLGSRYLVTYDMGMPGEVLRQDMYPYADGGPVVHLPGGQQFGGRQLHGGWLRADVALLDVLTDAGLPAVDPARAATTAPTAEASSQRPGGREAGAGGSWPARNAEWLLAGLAALCLLAAVWTAHAVQGRRRTARNLPAHR